MTFLVIGHFVLNFGYMTLCLYFGILVVIGIFYITLVLWLLFGILVVMTF